MPSMRQQAADGLRPGAVFQVRRTFSQADTQAFGDLTRDYNPVHYDEPFARGKGFAGLICHGLLFGSMICQVGGQLAWLATGMDFKFLAPVYLGDTITCRLTLTHLDQGGRAKAEAVFTNQAGERVASAWLSGRLPGEEDKRRLRQMMESGDPTNPLA